MTTLLLLPLGLSGCAHTPAVKQARGQVVQSPGEADTWIALGDAFRKSGARRRALEAYQHALVLSPDDPLIVERIAMVSQRDVRRLERKALKHPLNDELWGDVGDELLARGMREQALTYYLHALRIDPGDSEWNQKVLELSGPEGMLAVMEVTGTEMNDEALGDAADQYYELGELEQACELWARSAELDPGDSEWQNKLAAYCGLEVALGAEAMLAEELIAEAGLGGVIGVSEAPPAEQLGWAKLMAGDKEGALTAFEAALIRDPMDKEARRGVMLATDRTQVEVLTTLAERFESNDELWGDLGDALVNVGDLPGALDAYRKAQALDSDDTEWPRKVVVLASLLGEEGHEGRLFE